MASNSSRRIRHSGGGKRDRAGARPGAGIGYITPARALATENARVRRDMAKRHVISAWARCAARDLDATRQAICTVRTQPGGPAALRKKVSQIQQDGAVLERTD
jgi:hypothetical protein